MKFILLAVMGLFSVAMAVEAKTPAYTRSKNTVVSQLKKNRVCVFSAGVFAKKSMKVFNQSFAAAELTYGSDAETPYIFCIHETTTNRNGPPSSFHCGMGEIGIGTLGTQGMMSYFYRASEDVPEENSVPLEVTGHCNIRIVKDYLAKKGYIVGITSGGGKRSPLIGLTAIDGMKQWVSKHPNNEIVVINDKFSLAKSLGLPSPLVK